MRCYRVTDFVVSTIMSSYFILLKRNHLLPVTTGYTLKKRNIAINRRV